MFQQDAQKILGLLEIGDPQLTIGDLILLYNFGFGGTPHLRKPPYCLWHTYSQYIIYVNHYEEHPKTKWMIEGYPHFRKPLDGFENLVFGMFWMRVQFHFMKLGIPLAMPSK